MKITVIPPPPPPLPAPTYNIEGLTHDELKLLKYVVSKAGHVTAEEAGVPKTVAYPLYTGLKDALNAK